MVGEGYFSIFVASEIINFFLNFLKTHLHVTRVQLCMVIHCNVVTGIGAQHMKKVCPPDIEVVCHDAPNSCTLSGPAESLKKLTKLLQQKGVSVRELHCAGVALHSKQLAGVAPVLLKNLRKVECSTIAGWDD